MLIVLCVAMLINYDCVCRQYVINIFIRSSILHYRLVRIRNLGGLHKVLPDRRRVIFGAIERFSQLLESAVMGRRVVRSSHLYVIIELGDVPISLIILND